MTVRDQAQVEIIESSVEPADPDPPAEQVPGDRLLRRRLWWLVAALELGRVVWVEVACRSLR